MDVNTRDAVRRAVSLAVRYWPNAHLGEYAPREDIRSAFRMIRAHAASANNIHDGIAAVENDAYRHADM